MFTIGHGWSQNAAANVILADVVTQRSSGSRQTKAHGLQMSGRELMLFGALGPGHKLCDEHHRGARW